MPGLAQPNPKTGVPGGMFGAAAHILTGAGDLAAALMPSSMRMFMGGFYGTDVMGFAHNLLSQIPVAGRLLGALSGPFHQVMQQNDEFRNLQYETFRDAGADAMGSFTNLWTDDAYRDQFVKRFGFSRAETAQLVGGAARRGLGQGRGMEDVLNVQGALGLGQEATETLGAFRRGGLKGGQETDVLAAAIGAAVATGLERGRWGEMLTLWQRAAQSSVDTDVAWRQVASQQQFVGSLGDRFRGDTPAAQSMEQALRQMASNASSPFALRGAMQLSGGDFFGATARMARAAEQPDTELEGSVIDQMMSTPGVRSWLTMPDGPDADRALDRIAGVASTFGTGLSQLKIVTLLKAKKAAAGGSLFRPLSADAAAIGRRQVTGVAPLPGTALGPRRSQSEAQRPSGLTAIQEGGLGPSPAEQLSQSQAAREFLSLPPPPAAFGSSGSAGISSGFTPMGSLSSSGSSYKSIVSQGFGNPIAGRAPHPGTDLAFPPGTAVTSPVDGVVEHVNRNGAGLEVGAAVHIRASADGTLWKLYHIDPATMPPSIRVGLRVAQGTPLGRTYSNKYWQGPGGSKVRTHLHVGHVGAGGNLLDPLGPGGLAPGSLTGATTPSGSGPVTHPDAGGAPGSAGSNVSVDVHVFTHQDPAGRLVVRARAGSTSLSSSPGQLVGGSR